MSVDAVARPFSWRAIPWATLVLAVVAGLIVVRSLTLGQLSLGTLAFAGPVVFAAVVIYVRPQDRRFFWAALAIAATPAVSLVTIWLPDVWLSLAPDDWKNATPLLQDIGGVARELASLLGLVGLALLGLALGGVRTFMSAVIIAFGTLVAATIAIWYGAPMQGSPVLDLVRTIGFAVLNIVGWAFVFAAALESLRTAALMGFGLLFANTVINALLVMAWRPQRSSTTDLLVVVFALPEVIGWLVLIAAVLRGELSAARPAESARGRAARGTGAQRGAG